MKTVVAFVFCLSVTVTAFADPQLTSWLTTYSGQYARVYESTTKRSNGNSSTTWTNQSSPAYADVPQIYSSANWVYIRFPDLASYVMGPWLNPQGQVGTLWPNNQNGVAKIPRSPAVQSGTKDITGTGYSGNYVNGVAIFNSLDGKAWDGGALVSGPHNKPTYYWHRNAPVGESYNFDYGLGHQNPAGVYHTHQNPIGLRYELGDHVDFNSSTKNYSESTNTVNKHSPIVGWSYDGYPIYGPYGYSITNNANSGVRRMVSGYVERDGTTSGVDDISTNLGVIPAWYARFRQAHFGGSYSTAAGTNRAPVNSTYPIGTFAEDWSYLGDLTNSSTGHPYQQGTDFDLDEYNGRWCVTPEFTNGTYAYFVDIDSSGNSTYPYVFGFEYYGNAIGSNNVTISESVVTNFDGGGDSALVLNTPTVNSSDVVTLTWSSTEGGTYQVESSTNQSNWTVQKSGVAAAVGVTTTTNYTSSVTNGTSYVRLTRTALATYENTGGDSGVVGQTNVQSFTINSTPVVANPIPNQTNTYGSSFSYTFPANTFTDADAGQTLTYTASSSAFANTGISFDSTNRTFSATTIDATNGGTIAGSYTVQVVATDNGSPAASATNTFTLVINKAAASVTANSASRVYGGNNLTFTGSLSGFVAADFITANYSTTATTNSGATTYPITATLNDPGSRLGNYTVTTNTGTLTVTQAVLTVTANAALRAYGATNPVFAASYAGFTNAQTLASSGVSGSPSLTTGATTNSSPGGYAITNTTGTLSAANYSFSFVNGTLTVTQAALTVTANNTNRAYGATNPVFTGTISGIANNDTITATYTSSAVTNSAPGTYTITPTLNDPNNKLGNYTVTTNTGTLTVSKATLAVTVDAKSRMYGSTNPVFTASYSGFVNGETSASGTFTGSPSLATSAATNSVVGSYVITNSIGTLASGYYTFALTNGTLTVTQAPMSVAIDSPFRSYGQTNPVFTGTLTGVTAGDNITVTYNCSATTNSAPASYIISPTFIDPASRLGNYTVTTNLGMMIVSKAALVVSANAMSRAYGSTNPAFTASYSGFVNGETSSSGTISGAPALSTSADTNSPIGTYAITNALGTLTSLDYSFTLTNGTLTVTQASLTVTPANASRAYGATNPVFTGTISGIANNDNVTANYSTTAVTNSPVGTYPITATLNDPDSKLGNYNVTTNQGTLTVTNNSSIISINFAATSSGNGTSTPLALSETAGVLPAMNWNNSTNQTSGSLSNLLDSSGVTTTASITWRAPTMGTTATGNTTSDKRMMKGYIDATNGTVVTVTVTNIPSSISTGGYDVIAYFDGANGTANHVDKLTIGTNSFYGMDYTSYEQAGSYVQCKATSSSGNSTPAGNFMVFTNVTGNGFTLIATPDYASDNNSNAPVNGIQIIADSVARTTITTNPASVSACAGDTVTFTAGAQSASTLTMQWQVKTNGGSSFVNISGATNSTYSFTAAATNNGSQYEAVFTGYMGTATTAPATLSVTAIPDPTITTDSANVYANSSGHTASAPAGAATYSWTITNGTINGATNTQSVAFTAGSTGTVAIGLTVANANGCSTNSSASIPIVTFTQAQATLTNTDSIVSLATNVTKNYTFTDSASGQSVVVAVTMTPYSASNASPVFTQLDAFGPGGRAVHLGVDSGRGSGDGNWVDYYEGANFSASLVSASSGVATNSLQFAIVQMGLRPGGGGVKWTSSATTNSFALSSDALYSLDTNTMTLAGATYSATLRSTNSGTSYQISDNVNTNYNGLVLKVVFTGSSTPTITTNPASQAVIAGNTVSLTAGASSALTAQWQMETNGGSIFTSISGATNTSYSFTSALTDNGSQYRVIFANSYGSVTSAVATVTVYNLTLTTNPVSQAICYGDAVSFTAAATGNPTPAVQWQVETNGGSSYANITGATSSTYTFTPALTDDGNLYRAVFTNNAGSVTTAIASLSVNAVPDGTITPSATTVLANSTNSATAAYGAATYAWTISNGTILGATNTQTITYVAGTASSVSLGLTAANTSGCSASGATTISVRWLTNYAGSETIFVSDGNDLIDVLDTNGVSDYTIPYQVRPKGVAFSKAGDLYVSDVFVNDIETVSPDGTRTIFATNVIASALAFDGSGYLYAAANVGILRFATNGTSTVFATNNIGTCNGLAFDTSGNLYVANYFDGNIVKITPGGVTSIFASGFTHPYGLAFDASGNLFASDTGTNIIWKLNSSGNATVFATNGLSSAQGLAFDNEGNLYAANYGSASVEKFTTNGVGTVFATNNLDGPEYIAVWPLVSQLIPTNSTFGTITAGTPTVSSAVTYSNSQFSLSFTGTTGATYWVQASTNLTSWTTIATNTAPATFTDSNVTQYLQRYYRIVAP